MNIIKKTLIVTSVLATLASAGATSLNGQSGRKVIYITGSTAFRNTANGTLLSLFSNNLCATDSNSLTAFKAGNLYFTNVPYDDTSGVNIVGAQTNVDIAVYWSGSEAGVQSAASPNSNPALLPFLDYNKFTNTGAFTNNTGSNLVTAGGHTYATNIGGYSFSGSIISTSTNANTSLQKADICFSDTLQDTSLFKKNKTVKDVISNTFRKYGTLNQTAVGVTPFGWFVSAGGQNILTNMTVNIANQLIQRGYVRGNTISGNLSDSNTVFWFSGRFPDSGTRLQAYMAAKAGALASGFQFKINTNGTGNITGLDLYGPGTINGVAVSDGNNGYSSGGTLANLLTNTFVASPSITDSNGIKTFTAGQTNFVVTYIGMADAVGTTGYTNGTAGVGLQSLPFEGVVGRFCGSIAQQQAYTNAYAKDAGYSNIINGSYSFWATEQMGWTNSSDVVDSLGQTIANAITGYATTNTYMIPNIANGEMNVNRSSDGYPIDNN